MINRSIQIPSFNQPEAYLKKDLNSSLSTEGQNSPRDFDQVNYCQPSIKKNKEKSQLCKKFIQFGFCPYEKKCKFAHGCHELKKNQLPNSKYKTKQCGAFLTEGFCMYGQRCNFIHEKTVRNCQTRMDKEFQEIKAECRLQSKLLKLLNIAC